MAENEPEFSRSIARAALDEGPVEIDASASADERAALAARFGIPGIERFRVSGTLELDRATGRTQAVLKLDAVVVQSCVVTLDPVVNKVEETIEQEIVFAAAQPASSALNREVHVDLEEEPEVVYGDVFDVGEFAAQQLLLALDPYPRKPGARFQGYDESGSVSAFADLAKLKDRLAKR